MNNEIFTLDFNDRVYRKDLTLEPVLLDWAEAALAQKPTSVPFFRNAIWAFSQLDYADSERRTRLASVLLEVALIARNSDRAADSEVLLGALSRYCSVVEPSAVDALINFLRPEDKGETRQVVAQGIQEVFWNAPAASPLKLRVFGRLMTLAATYNDEDVLVFSAVVVLAGNVNVALMLMSPLLAPQLAFDALCSPRLWRFMATKLDGFLTRRKEAGIKEDDCLLEAAVILTREGDDYAVSGPNRGQRKYAKSPPRLELWRELFEGKKP